MANIIIYYLNVYLFIYTVDSFTLHFISFPIVFLYIFYFFNIYICMYMYSHWSRSIAREGRVRQRKAATPCLATPLYDCRGSQSFKNFMQTKIKIIIIIYCNNSLGIFINIIRKWKYKIHTEKEITKKLLFLLFFSNNLLSSISTLKLWYI